MKRGIIIACLIGLMAGLTARAEETNAPPKPPAGNGPAWGGGNRPMMDNIIMPRVLDELALTADQKTKYDPLEKDFKAEVAKLREANGGDMQKNRLAMRDLRRSYQDKVRAFLTDEQKTKLDKAQERARAAMRGGPGGSSGGPGGAPPPPPPPPPPADK
jgi:Spy/CpxP family protein refolding chaperone